MTEKKTTGHRVVAQATSGVLLLQYGGDEKTILPSNSFSVRLGLRRIMRFFVKPRYDDCSEPKPRTTRKDCAVGGWRSGSLSGTVAGSDSLYNVIADLAAYGLDVEPVLAAAIAQGWPEDIVTEARERAEETYQYVKDQKKEGW